MTQPDRASGGGESPPGAALQSPSARRAEACVCPLSAIKAVLLQSSAAQAGDAGSTMLRRGFIPQPPAHPAMRTGHQAPAANAQAAKLQEIWARKVRVTKREASHKAEQFL